LPISFLSGIGFNGPTDIDCSPGFGGHRFSQFFSTRCNYPFPFHNLNILIRQAVQFINELIDLIISGVDLALEGGHVMVCFL